jgi:hypothetical protein
MGRFARIVAASTRRLAVVALVLTTCTPALAEAPSVSSRVPGPGVTAPAAGACVEDKATMRRSHMDMIRHQRDLTVREGIRTTRHSLAACIDCHADPATGRVTGSPQAFCEGCHRYVAAKPDCFDCHSDRARTSAALAGGASR